MIVKDKLSDEEWERRLRAFQAASRDAEDAVYTMLVQYVIYERPSDFPAHFVIRRYEISESGVVTGDALCYKTLEAARAVIPSWAVCMGRTPDDDPKIVEVWT